MSGNGNADCNEVRQVPTGGMNDIGGEAETPPDTHQEKRHELAESAAAPSRLQFVVIADSTERICRELLSYATQVGNSFPRSPVLLTHQTFVLGVPASHTHAKVSVDIEGRTRSDLVLALLEIALALRAGRLEGSQDADERCYRFTAERKLPGPKRGKHVPTRQEVEAEMAVLLTHLQKTYPKMTFEMREDDGVRLGLRVMGRFVTDPFLDERGQVDVAPQDYYRLREKDALQMFHVNQAAQAAARELHKTA